MESGVYFADYRDNRGLRRPKWRTHAILLVSGCLGGVLVLAGTHRFGPAVTPDSATYVAAANSLLAGEGYLGYDGLPYAEKPPLYPTILAAGRMVGMDPIETAPVLHAIVFTLIIFCTGLLLFSRLRGGAFAWIGLAAVALSWPLLQVAVKVWSELIFILLVVVFLALVPGLMARPSRLQVFLLSLVAAFAMLQRYAGVALVLAGACMILFFMRRASLRRRLRYAAGFCLISVAPIVPWLIRNYLATSTLTGTRTFSSDLLARESVVHLAETLNTWIVPPLLPVWVGHVVGIILLGLVAFNFIRPARRGGVRAHLLDRAMLLFVIAYTAVVTFSSMVESSPMPDNRFLSPLYVPLVYLVVVGLNRTTARRSPHARHGGPVRRTAVVACVLWLLYPAVSAGVYVSVRSSYDTNVWHNSAMAQWLDEKPPEGRLYSNRSWVVYLSTRKYARRFPLTDLDACAFPAAEVQGQTCVLAWFYGTNRGQDHASRFLYDFFSRVTAGRDPVSAKGLTGATLEFMRRSGLTSRGDPPDEIDERSAPVLPQQVHAEVIDTFADGVLYSVTDARPARRSEHEPDPDGTGSPPQDVGDRADDEP